MAHPGGVDQKAPFLGVLQESVVDAGLGGLGLGDDRGQVIGDEDRENAFEELPAELQALYHRFCRLAVSEPDEHVPGPDRHQYEGVGHSPP